MNIDAGLAPSLTDAELINHLHQSRCALTDTPAELELLRRFENLLYAGDNIYADVTELLDILEEYDLTHPDRLSAVLAAAQAIMQLPIQKGNPCPSK